MSQQMGIIVLVDNAAAIETGSLQGNLHLFDNGRWSGSRELGTDHMVTAIDATQSWTQNDVPVLNWIPVGIGGPPPALPQQQFLNPFDRRMIADVPQPVRRPLYAHPRILDAFGRDMRLAALSGAADAASTFYPDPVICNIAGEAVEKGVIFPAQYGSPDFFSEGLYWSATVDVRHIGLFAYTMTIKLYHSRTNLTVAEEDAVVLCQDAYIDITNASLGETARVLTKVPEGLAALGAAAAAARDDAKGE